jgi:hypothetical protein
MLPKIPWKEDLFKTLDDLNHDLSRGQPYQVQVMQGIHVLATFHQARDNLWKFLTKQRGQFTFHVVSLGREKLFCRTFAINFIHDTYGSFLVIPGYR